MNLKITSIKDNCTWYVLMRKAGGNKLGLILMMMVIMAVVTGRRNGTQFEWHLFSKDYLPSVE